MKLKFILTILSVVALWAPFSAPVYAQEEPAAEATEAPPIEEPEEEGLDKWEYRITGTGWLSSAGVDLAGPSRSISTTVKATDVLENIQFAIGGGAEVRKGKWGGMIDGTFLRVKETVDYRPSFQPGRTLFTLTPDVRISSFQAAATYRFVDSEKFHLDALAGVRYFDIDIILGAAPAGQNAILPSAITLQQSKSAFDPIIGGKGAVAFGEDVDGYFYGDVGGFGVSSDFTYRVEAGADWKFHENWSANLGYRVQGISFSTSRGPGNFDFDTTLYGPLIGLSFRN